LDKAVEIKRRAQRCVQNGDLDGALSEYEKLVAADDTDPYNFVLLADLLYKKGDQGGAADRYLSAAASYEAAGLFKNGIAVCKKMLRLSLAPARVLRQLAALHAADGLGAEAALYYMQYAEHQVRAEQYPEAAEALRKAFDVSNENVKALERLAEVKLLEEDRAGAAIALAEAARHYGKSGQLQAAEQCKRRGREMDEKAFESGESAAPSGKSAPRSEESAPEPGVKEIDRFERPTQPADVAREEGLESSPPRLPKVAAAESEPESAPESNAPAAAESSGVRGDGGDAGSGSVNATEPIHTIESAWKESSEAPGLRFASPGERPAPARTADLAKVEKLLAEAQEAFKAGDRERAGQTLAVAAEAYETAGQLDQAATIYRSLAKSTQAPEGTLERWLANCEQREDGSEAAHVACELGDRALAANQADAARNWFEKALVSEAGHELATRRLQRLGDGNAAATVTPKASAPAVEQAPAPQNTTPDDAESVEAAEPEAKDDSKPAPAGAASTNGSEPGGRVELAVGRGEAVTFDLGSLISEFQRGVEAQLSGDAQSHYDLAMAYREMGLLEQSVDSFRIAQKDPVFADRCAEMIGRCLLDQGRFDDAAEEFKTALASGRLDVETEVNLRYQLGLAHEAEGRVPEALAEFEGVYAAQPNFPDVALKIRVLRKSLENI
jgi:tetratricopeptide (TPR) repeat protein